MLRRCAATPYAEGHRGPNREVGNPETPFLRLARYDSRSVRIRVVQPHDAGAWERMRESLWPAAEGEHAREIRAFFDGARDDPAEVFIAEGEGALIGFAEVSIRSHAEGCEPGRIAYLEGWWVEPEGRRQGVGGALIDAVSEWARGRGCSALASDAELGNAASHAAHQALGFEEVDRIVCFRKSL